MMKNNTDAPSPRPITRLIRGVMVLCIWLGAAAVPAGAQPSMEPETGLGLYAQVDRWVRDWDLPSIESPEALSEPVCAAVVTLRLDGQVFGRGTAASPDPDPSLIWRATSRAVNRANSKLTGERDAMWDATVKQLSERLTITIEVGDELIPIAPSNITMPGFGHSPGSVGLAARLGDECDTIGPESIITRRGDPAQYAAALALTLSDDANLVLQNPDELSKQGFVFYRWSPMVLAQPAPGLGAVFVDRGGRVIEADEMTMRSIDSLAEQIAAHLRARRWAGVEQYGFVGTLDPVEGRSASPFAGAFEQALGAYALLRYGQDGDSVSKREAVVTGREVLSALAHVEEDEQSPWADPVAACMAIVAMAELPLEMILGDRELGELRTQCLKTLDTLYSDQDGFADSVPTAAHGLVAHALSASALIDPRDRKGLARSAIGRVFLETPPELLVSQMPFLAWAQLHSVDPDQEVPSRTALRQMRELVWEHQLRRADLSWADRDLVGGIVFTRAAAPLPSWSSLRPLSAIATMLGDERLTEGTIASGEVPGQITRLVESIRFVRQLTAEGELLHLYGEAEDAQGGVRMALWDQRMPIESSAMALLLLAESQRSFEQLMSR
ncbi:MAG: hypothetical protein CMJ35_05135 [Phycisphaerae bacterium]|nr:hypothetical protein [Phycisphaerae bacterium]